MEFASPTPVAEPVPPAPPTEDFVSAILADHLRELIWTGARSSERSLQREVGMSEVGTGCDRELVYKIAGIPPSNLGSDPMPAIMGTGFHLHMERLFARLDPRRYLVEQPVRYRGIPGTLDLYDRRRRLGVDWKSTSKAKLRTIRKDGPTVRQQVQIQTYGAALRELGEDPQRLALVFVPRDGTLDDLYVWSTVPDQAFVDQWIGRYEALQDAVAKGKSPADISPSPSRLCTFCDHHVPGSTDPSRGCPGNNP